MVRSQALTIARLAAAAGVGVETVRYYQRRGLLRTPGGNSGRGGASGRAGTGGRTGATGWVGDSARVIRRYTDEDVRRLRFIRSAQSAGFTLEKISELLVLDSTRQRARARQLAQEQLAALDAKIKELSAAREALRRHAHICAAGTSGPCPIISAFGSGHD